MLCHANFDFRENCDLFLFLNLIEVGCNMFCVVKLSLNKDYLPNIQKIFDCDPKKQANISLMHELLKVYFV